MSVGGKVVEVLVCPDRVWVNTDDGGDGAMVKTHGMHGPCKENSCSDCDRAYKMAVKAIREAEGEIPE